MTFKQVVLIGALLSLLSFSGCFNSTADEQTVPWGRPASWEGGAPGMGGY